MINIDDQPSVPRHSDDVDSHWLTQALRASGLDVTVASVERESLGEGVGMMSGLERLRVTYDEATGSTGPATLILKRPADNEANLAVASMFELYRREVLFYRDVASRCSAPTPTIYYADIDGSDFAIIVEDLTEYELGDQVAGCALDEARTVMGWMGRLHATFWGATDDPTLEFLPMVYPSYSSEGLMQGAAFGWDPMVAGFPEIITPEFAALKDRYIAALPKLYEWMAAPPLTVLHGDVRMDNLFFGTAPGQDPLMAVDWQGALRGRAAQDVGYFMSGNIPIDVRREHEHELIDIWHAELCANGVTDYSRDDAWLDYRLGSLYVWTIAIVIGGTLDHTNERGRQWVSEMLARSIATFEDLDLVELIDQALAETTAGG